MFKRNLESEEQKTRCQKVKLLSKTILNTTCSNINKNLTFQAASGFSDERPERSEIARNARITSCQSQLARKRVYPSVKKIQEKLLSCQASQQRRFAFTKPSRAARIAEQSERRTIIIGNRTFRFDCERWRLMRGAAFTLAEVLITLGVVGIVAAITMPMLISNINERVNSERQANIVYKVTQAMEHMRATGKLIEYDSTESFVNELQKHLKIQKICDKDHLTECWPTETVTNSAGDTVRVSDAKTSKKLGFRNRANVTNNVGLILADGASLILNYDAGNTKVYDIGDKVEASSIGLPVGNNKSKVFQYTTSVTGPIAFAMDVNGKRGPNSETIDGKYNDIRSFNGAGFNYVPTECYNGTCIYYVGKSYNSVNCSNSNYPNYSYCYPHPSGLGTDYWAGAKYKCSSIDMDLPTMAELRAVFANIDKYPSIPNADMWFYSSEECDCGTNDSGCMSSLANCINSDRRPNSNAFGKHDIWGVLCIVRE